MKLFLCKTKWKYNINFLGKKIGEIEVESRTILPKTHYPKTKVEIIRKIDLKDIDKIEHIDFSRAKEEVFNLMEEIYGIIQEKERKFREIKGELIQKTLEEKNIYKKILDTAEKKGKKEVEKIEEDKKYIVINEKTGEIKKLKGKEIESKEGVKIFTEDNKEVVKIFLEMKKKIEKKITSKIEKVLEKFKEKLKKELEEEIEEKIKEFNTNKKYIKITNKIGRLKTNIHQEVNSPDKKHQDLQL